MTDLEAALRLRLNGELEPLTLAPDVAGAALLQGRRLRRQRTTWSAAAAVVAVAAVAGLTVTQPWHTGALTQPAGRVTTVDQAEKMAQELADGDFDPVRASFTPELKANLSVAGLARTWGLGLSQRHGATGAATATEVARGRYELSIPTSDGRALHGVLQADTDGRVNALFAVFVADAGNGTLALAKAYGVGDFGAADSQLAESAKTVLRREEIARVWQLAVNDGGALDAIVLRTIEDGNEIMALEFDHGNADLRVVRGGDRILYLSLLATDPVREPLTRAVVADFVANRFAHLRASFDSRMSAGLKEPELAQVWQSALDKHGALLGVRSITTQRTPQGTVQAALCQMRIGQLVVQVSYDHSNHVSGLYLREP
jgi:hypothetical protein